MQKSIDDVVQIHCSGERSIKGKLQLSFPLIEFTEMRGIKRGRIFVVDHG